MFKSNNPCYLKNEIFLKSVHYYLDNSAFEIFAFSGVVGGDKPDYYQQSNI